MTIALGRHPISSRDAITRVVIRWRLGRTGSMVLSLARGSDDQAGFRGELIRSGTESVAIAATALEDRGETSIRLEAEHAAWRASLCIVRRGADFGHSEGSPLILTDLPARIGLRGGTYGLESVTVEAATESSGVTADSPRGSL
ncbi:MAG: hypothetical protein ACO31E_03350 [Phycisphaerales bacterium]